MKRGRPKKAKSESRAPGLSVRLTKDESKLIQAAIDESNLKRSDWARKALLYVAENKVKIV